MRILLLLTLLALPAAAENEDVVKDTRAVYAALKQKDLESAKQKLFARDDLDWPSVRKGLMEGRYYRAPMSTNYGVRYSGKHMKMRLRGDDSKERGFTLWVPKSYNAKDKIPVLFYLHHNAFVPEPNHGAGLSLQFINRFKKAAEDHGVLVVAPYTSTGAEWWLPEGKRLVEWTLERVKEHYNIDENRIALMGAQDGAGGVWAIGQEMPGTWSCLMPMSGNHYSITAMVRPLYLGTLDRMDVMIGVTGKLKGRLGEIAAHQYLHNLKPMIDKGMRITTVVAPSSSGDFRYLPRVREDVLGWVKSKT
ncbi:MAG: hypothetical protein ACYTGN_11505, partial [Planctomycetota bacterium]